MKNLSVISSRPNHSLALNSVFPIKYSLNLNWKLFWRIFWILNVSLLSALLIFYLFQIHETTKQNYLLANYEKKIISLSKENKNLEINFSKYVGLENIEALVKNLNFEKPEKIHYLRILPETVVTK